MPDARHNKIEVRELWPLLKVWVHLWTKRPNNTPYMHSSHLCTISSTFSKVTHLYPKISLTVSICLPTLLTLINSLLNTFFAILFSLILFANILYHFDSIYYIIFIRTFANTNQLFNSFVPHSLAIPHSNHCSKLSICSLLSSTSLLPYYSLVVIH